MFNSNFDHMFISPLFALGALVLLALGVILQVLSDHNREDQER